MMTPIQDYFVIKLDKIFDVREQGGLITLNDAYIREGERDRNIYKRIWGQVVAIPRGYSGLNIDPQDEGVPNARIYVSHDIIQERVNEGYPWTRETHYHPGVKESFEFKTVDDVAQFIDVKIGDKIYAHPNSLESENALYKLDTEYYFRIRVDEILCAVRDGKLIAQGQHVLLKRNMEKQEDIFRGGLQIKPDVEAKPLQGFCVCARPEFCPTGILVFFIPDADWLITIEGMPVYCLREEDIYCFVER
jgi:hypothetical protein